MEQDSCYSQGRSAFLLNGGVSAEDDREGDGRVGYDVESRNVIKDKLRESSEYLS